jgi:hypothetical protein
VRECDGGVYSEVYSEECILMYSEVYSEV